MSEGRGSCSFSPPQKLEATIKNKYTKLKDVIEILVTNYNFDNKNYLIFSICEIFKKRVFGSDGYNYPIFSSFTSVFPSEYSTTQLILSPISKSKNCITSLGIVVLADLLLGLAKDTFVEYLNTTFIPPIFGVHSILYDKYSIYKFPICR